MRHKTSGPPPGTAEAERQHWRPDIQGLRAIAVLAVVAFHAGLPVPGGFTGVDVFFVISGFVIAAMLQREWRTRESLSLRTFYWRRFARLTPALALMVAVTVVLAALLLSPLGPQQTTAYTALGAMALIANFVITWTTGNYFAAPASANPLLHTWSLSVEEQFYLVFPSLLLLGWVVGRRWRRLPMAAGIVALVFVVSFGAALIGSYVGVGPRTGWLIGFYGPLSRAWEFSAGALLVLVPWRAISGRLAAVLRVVGTVAGWLLLVVSFWVINENTPFPGAWTLAPVIGTSLLIGVGSSAPRPSRILANSPMTYVGDRSYSIYLWHWPFIVLSIAVWPSVSWVPFIAAVVSFAPALASYRWLEAPVRRSALQPGTHRLRLVSIVIGIPVALATLLLITAQFVLTPAFKSGNWPQTTVGSIDPDEFDAWFNSLSDPCPNVTPPIPISPAHNPMCNESRPGEPRRVIVLGDSHGGQTYPGLVERLPDVNVVFADTLLVPDLAVADNAWIVDLIEDSPDLETAVLTASWYSRGVPVDQMQQTINFLHDRGIDVVLVGDNPDFPFGAESCKYPRSIVLPPICDIPAELSPSRASARADLEELAAANTDAVFVDARTPFCTTDVCSMAVDDQMVNRDFNHLNDHGSRMLASLILERAPSVAAFASDTAGSTD